jgi:PEGA domain
LSGIAVPRRVPDTTLVSFPLYGPWGRWYPWYGSGFGWNLGFVTYNPWHYGAARWYWGRYGLWYDPFIYDPYWYYPYYPHDGGYSSGGGGRDDYDEPKSMVGSIRLKVNPSSAQVYVDGALVGTADGFDGLSDHLELDGGKHTIELRAEGYETYRGEIDVKVGKTLTERVSLKKIKS